MEISSKNYKTSNLQKKWKFARFQCGNMIFTPFCANEFSIKWKFGQEFTTLSFKNGIPFYRECTVHDCMD